MQFNPSKCEFLAVINKASTPTILMRYQLKQCNMLSTYKLEVIIDSKLTWKEHIKITTYKANTALAFLRCNLKSCSLYIKTKCYLGTVRPIIEYACTVCGHPILLKTSTKLKWFKGELLNFYNITNTIILLTFSTCSNHLDGPLYKQEDTTLSCY